MGKWPLLWMICSILIFACGREEVKGPESHQSDGPVQLVDRRYRPGLGPSKDWEVLLLKSYPEKVWLTGLSLKVLDEQGQELSGDYLDEAWLDYVYPDDHHQRFSSEFPKPNSLFRLNSGSLEEHLPAAYGIPQWSNEPLRVRVRWKQDTVMVKSLKLKAQVTCHFVRDRALDSPLKSVVPLNLVAAAPLGERPVFAMAEEKAELPAGVKSDLLSPLVDKDGFEFSEQWELDGPQELSFPIGGQLEAWSHWTPVHHQLFAYSSIDEVQLEIGEQRADLRACQTSEIPSFGESDATAFLHLNCRGKLGSRGHLRLMLYFLQEDFVEFPELRL